MNTLLLYIWQLPQNVLGLLLFFIICITNKLEYSCHDRLKPFMFIKVKLSGFGITLGKYIFLGPVNNFDIEMFHEKGHAMQSKKYGPLYLFIVGIPSILRQIPHRYFHKNWPYSERMKWYYSGWPEKEADKLAGVDRYYKI